VENLSKRGAEDMMWNNEGHGRVDGHGGRTNWRLNGMGGSGKGAKRDFTLTNGHQYIPSFSLYANNFQLAQRE
jgi:hypothetical protein